MTVCQQNVVNSFGQNKVPGILWILCDERVDKNIGSPGGLDQHGRMSQPGYARSFKQTHGYPPVKVFDVPGESNVTGHPVGLRKTAARGIRFCSQGNALSRDDDFGEAVLGKELRVTRPRRKQPLDAAVGKCPLNGKRLRQLHVDIVAFG